MINIEPVPEFITENWNQQKEILKTKISILTGTDSDYTNGKKEDIVKMLQIKFGITKEEVLKIISAV